MLWYLDSILKYIWSLFNGRYYIKERKKKILNEEQIQNKALSMYYEWINNQYGYITKEQKQYQYNKIIYDIRVDNIFLS